VDTVKALRTRKPDKLAQALATTDAQRHVTRATPGVRSVRGWISKAAWLHPVIKY
jgi:hypothetical protein